MGPSEAGKTTVSGFLRSSGPAGGRPETAAAASWAKAARRGRPYPDRAATQGERLAGELTGGVRLHQAGEEAFVVEHAEVVRGPEPVVAGLGHELEEARTAELLAEVEQ